MARIRTIKPEFFTSRSLSRVSRDARLTFAGMWCQADDHGRGVADVRILKGAIWPLEDDIQTEEITAHLQELLSTGHIVLYRVNSEMFFEVVGWSKHQAAAYTRGTPKHPDKAEGTLCTSLHDSSFPVVQESAYKEGKGSEADSLIADALSAYVLSVCVEAKQTSARYRDGVHAKAMSERVPVLRAHMQKYPNSTLDDLRELLGLERMEVVEPKQPSHDPECPHCDGDGVRTIDLERNVMAPCDGQPVTPPALRVV